MLFPANEKAFLAYDLVKGYNLHLVMSGLFKKICNKPILVVHITDI